ncbi:DNA polymerase III subunit beta [Paenibacillus periandrae]|uniref:DNA polymerase III subunit beta n=1 Tax=Paenibacillus periandrae TaxID=1761741 RepID=UPI001F08B19A|nr:DNA polymerase III subunit beta [Paenibacillus periandrae]
MFKMNSSKLQDVVAEMAKSVKVSCIGDRNVYIKNSGKNIVSFYFTSIDLSGEKKVSATVTEDFFVTTSMKELANKVDALPSHQEIDITYVKKKDTQYIEMVWGTNGRRSEMKVRVLNETTEFMEIPVPSEKVIWGPNLLSQLVEKFNGFTVKSTSEAARTSPIFSGISISQSPSGHCILQACDRLNGVTYESKNYNWVNLPVIIDTAHLRGIENMISSDSEVEVGINKSASLVIFQTPDTTCVCRVIDGVFPDLLSKYEYDVECRYIFDRAELMELCARVQKITSTGTKTVRFENRKGENRKNTVFAVVPQVLEQQLGTSVEGIKWNFAVNAEKLNECLKFFEAQEEITLYIKDPLKPITIGSDEVAEVMMYTTPYRISDFINTDGVLSSTH